MKSHSHPPCQELEKVSQNEEEVQEERRVQEEELIKKYEVLHDEKMEEKKEVEEEVEVGKEEYVKEENKWGELPAETPYFLKVEMEIDDMKDAENMMGKEVVEEVKEVEEIKEVEEVEEKKVEKEEKKKLPAQMNYSPRLVKGSKLLAELEEAQTLREFDRLKEKFSTDMGLKCGWSKQKRCGFCFRNFFSAGCRRRHMRNACKLMMKAKNRVEEMAKNG